MTRKIYLALLLVLAACGREAVNEQTPISVIRAANGHLYDAHCVRDTDLRDVDECELDVDGEDSDARGFYQQGRAPRRPAYQQSMIFWDLYSFQPRDICQVFSKTFQDYQVCQMWLGLPQQQRPWTPSCQSNWIVSPYQPQYAQGGCGIPWYPQPIPMPMPIPTPKGKELLRIQVADRAAGPNNTITFKLSAVPDTNEIAPYKFTKQSCKDGYCSQEQLIGRVNQEEFKSLQAKAGAAKSGTIVEPPRPEIQCLAYGPRTTYLANNGETLLLIDESCGGAVLKNMSTAAADLVTWLKSKQK